MNLREDYEDFLKFREKVLRWQKQSKILDWVLFLLIVPAIALCAVATVMAWCDGRVGYVCLNVALAIVNSVNGVTLVKRMLGRREKDIAQRECLDAIKSTFEERLRWEEEHDSLQG